MSPTTTTTATAPTTRALRADELACVACGVAVAGPHDEADVEVATSLHPEANPARQHAHELRFARCPECAAIHQTAVDLLRAFPDVRARIGDPTIAVYRLDLALCALDAAGVRDPAQIDRLTAQQRDIRRLIDTLAVVGGGARWVAKFAPRPERGLRFETATTERWGHLEDEQRAELRHAVAGVLAARVERAVPIPAPADENTNRPSGCLLCGVSTWPAKPSQADGIWTERSASPGALGGVPSPERLYGVTCPRCERACERTGAVGHTAMVASVVDFLKINRMVASTLELDGMVGWVVTGRTPNDTPWEHVSLSALQTA